MALNKLIDITRLTEYHGLLKALIDKKFGDIDNTIGVVPSKIGEGENEQTVSNLVDYIQKSIALVNSDASALEGRVAANETAIGNKESIITAEAYASLDTNKKALYTAITEGENTGKYIRNASGLYLYIDDAAAAVIAKVVAGANTSYDTLQEIEAWIKNNTTGAASMQNAIKVLQGTDGTTQTKDSLSIPGVKLYIDSIVSNKNVDAGVAEGEVLLTATPSGNKVTVASTQKLQDAVERAEKAVLSLSEGTSKETYVTLTVTDGDNAKVAISDAALAAKIGEQKGTSDATGMYADIQGNTTTTIAALDAKVGDIKAVGTESPTTVVDYIDKTSAANVAALCGGTASTLKAVENKVDALGVADASDITDLFPEE